MKTKILFIILSAFVSFTVLAKSSGSSGVGNGGDSARDSFITIGKNIIQNYGSGLQLIEPELKIHNFKNYKDLEVLLSIDVISTSKEILIDNRGSIVSAIGEPKSIVLYVGNEHPELNWNKILQNTAKSERLVLHELLRAAEVNDDNYIFTNLILKEQGKIFDDKFNFNWSKNNDSIITSALTISMSSKDQISELNSFRKFTKNLIDRNNTKTSELLKIYLQFQSDLDSSHDFSSQGHLEMLIAYRETYKNLRIVNATIDQLGLKLLAANNKEGPLFAKFLILNLRQLQTRMMQFKEIDKNLLVDYVHTLSLLTSTNEYAADSFSMMTIAFNELESLISTDVKKDKLVEKCSQMIKMLQSLAK